MLIPPSVISKIYLLICWAVEPCRTHLAKVLRSRALKLLKGKRQAVSIMNRQPSSRQCVHCGASARQVTSHSRYLSRDGIRTVFRCRQCRRTFCDRFGTAFYDLKTEEAKVQRAIHEVMEGLGYAAVARIEEGPPTSVHRWIDRGCAQAVMADHKIVQQTDSMGRWALMSARCIARRELSLNTERRWNCMSSGSRVMTTCAWRTPG